MLNWDDLNYFLTLSRTGKLNLASKKLNVESTTISRRVIRLEKKLLFYSFQLSTVYLKSMVILAVFFFEEVLKEPPQE